MTGTHILCSFQNSPGIQPADLTELADRLTGSNGYVQHNIWTAFAYSFTGHDGTHDNNIARFIYETGDAFQYDYLDSFDRLLPVDSVKSVFTIGG